MRDSSSGETGFGIVMGSGGTLFGFCLYRGTDGFEMYRQMMEGSIDFERDDFFATQNCLKLELGPHSGLQPEDNAVIRQLGLTFKGGHAWPEFRSLLPGYAPWFLTEGEAQFLTLGLSITCHHAERVAGGQIDESIRDRKYLLYTPSGGSTTEYNARWEQRPVAAPQPIVQPVLNLSRIDPLRAKDTKPDTAWQAGVFYLPSPIYDRERPYYMRVAAVCQKSSGFVFAAEASLPEPTTHQLLADAICFSMEKHRLKPDTIFVNGANEAAALMSLSKALGFTIRRQKKLRGILMLKEDMLERFVYGGGQTRKGKL